MKLKDIGGMKPVIAGLIVGAVLIAIGMVTSDADGNSAKPDAVQTVSAQSNVELLESRLTELIEAMDGTGNVRVMIFADDDGCVEYAQDFSGASSENVVLGNGSDERLAELRRMSPDITGVAVVCPGTSENVRTSIAMLIRSLFGISSAKIYVCQ